MYDGRIPTPRSRLEARPCSLLGQIRPVRKFVLSDPSKSMRLVSHLGAGSEI